MDASIFLFFFDSVLKQTMYTRTDPEFILTLRNAKWKRGLT